ncbi:ImmA/IrrE family metallo-endopeptidase [Brevibacillus porteri]|uniref:ImmA/IrrE family metallo-endopeptidase n=1 Tax=Brevibacillus porteri TaxID=2126350 RepID=A0ABX5FM58_9BACL|nr:ImmA/IrrE family metallo-endopeptidase [Brevibacillus porteri]MED1800686.1 ImmA/IrrE family metallo-endopeptidase [Brevibacillus porteri]MED2133188.1 ImmA/IrrE family metallo-endopeptidase [Brevibacillus porteri]MED2746058.1 ImmA/IrrE family metallo-endopeptidase [Brevibacillus porteri]MED2817367.1 ImmA/IrrE family metallo-endopeptidase [Brevibacillus porteri]MED2896176.1 ImmA/IrrE family metallo-endopeptidase [Brevibacillus porteri]
MTYEELYQEATQLGIDIYEMPLKPRINGLYGDNVIGINKFIPTSTEKVCILAEELGHYFTSSGDILDQSEIANRKQEKRARSWGYEKLIPLNRFVQAHKHGIRNRYELADHLGVTEDFLESAINRYIEKYGTHVMVGTSIVTFEPLGVAKLFE